MAAPTRSVFSETLQQITNAKLEELSKRRTEYETTKSNIISSLGKQDSPITRLKILSEGVKACFSGQSAHAELDIELTHLSQFLVQARYDPSVSPDSLKKWENSLLHHLDTQSMKYQYASLYAQLVTEWLSTEKSKSSEDEDMTMAEEFEAVAGEMKREARQDWERVVFEPAKVYESGLRAYLEDLFGLRDVENTKKAKALRGLQSKVKEFEKSLLAPNQFNVMTLTWVAEGLLTSDLLTDDRREVLRDFKNNHIILAEISDVLNMRLQALESWSWGECVSLEQRRKISGIYNVLMHEDLLQAMFLHYIGTKWSVFLKKALGSFMRSSGVWKSSGRDIPKRDVKRRGYYLGPENRSRCVQLARSTIYRNYYFMADLMDFESQQSQALEGEEEAQYGNEAAQRDYALQLKLLQQQNQNRMQMTRQYRRSDVQSMDHGATDFSVPPGMPEVPLQPMQQKVSRQRPHRATRQAYEPGGDMMIQDFNSDSDREDEDIDIAGFGVSHVPKNPMEDKQRLVRLLSTEIAINTKLYGEFTAFHSTFENLNSLLPHQTILTVLDFLGVSNTWMTFFARFLKAPLKFLNDDPSTEPRTRCRGTPASHALSEVFAESIMFCLDFAVNQSTRGSRLFRLYDDCWFWSRDHSDAVTAWRTISDFADVTSTSISPSKSGSVRISKDPSIVLDIDRSLPQGDIRWGFLKLSTRSGKFEIDQKMVDKHIVDLRKQLQDKRKSIISFIQAWNTYAATFFTSNFGKPANCFGQHHVDEMLATHQRIQTDTFATSSSSSLVTKDQGHVTSVVGFLKSLIQERFGVSDVPEAYFFFPVELGGLDLKSPFISILQVRDTVLKDPTQVLDKFLEAERDEYDRRKQIFYKGKVPREGLEYPNWEPESIEERENFMSFEEFVRYREDLNYNFTNDLPQVFDELLQLPREAGIVTAGARLDSGIKALTSQNMQKGITGSWPSMNPYWKWVAKLYGPEAMDRFGGLTMVEPGLLPMGMVSIFRDKRVQWHG